MLLVASLVFLFISVCEYIESCRRLDAARRGLLGLDELYTNKKQKQVINENHKELKKREALAANEGNYYYNTLCDQFICDNGKVF